MKKIKRVVLFVIGSYMHVMTVNAQTPVQPIIDPRPKDPSNEIANAVNDLPTTTRPDWVEIYPQTNFRGRVARYAENIPNYSYPFSFSNRRGTSLKVAPGYIAYITFNEENPQEGIFIGNHPNFGSSNLYDIKSIRVVMATTAYINFCGFSTQIHNNDCKRIFGSVKIRFLERMPSGALIPCPMTGMRGGGTGTASGIYTPAAMFRKVNDYPDRTSITFANMMLGGRNIPQPDTYINNYDGTTVPSIPNIMVLPEGSAAGYAYTVSQQALSENRIVVEFESDLGVQHKSNDLATDYSSNVRMLEPVKTTLDFLNLGTSFTVGDFELKGNPNNNYGMASGVKYSIIKKLRIHFNKMPTPPRRR